MGILQVQGNKIVEQDGNQVQLRGTCVGGWMNMENFINGYPGSEQGLRAVMQQELGQSRAAFFFERLLDYFLAEEDFAFIKQSGANVVRLPLNYRQFERDSQPFEYLEAGFERLDRAIEQCGRQGLYVILDLHALPGWQNTDWHSDNPNRASLFWEHPHFQDRFVGLWQELARRYRGNPTIAGYNVMNEPLTNAPRGRWNEKTYQPDWPNMNRIYHRIVEAIRQLDPDHIIFLEGDCFSTLFEGLEAPFAPNLVYSSHNYNQGGFGPGAYPGLIGGEQWDKTRQLNIFRAQSGSRFSREYNVPLWVGEFGSIYNGPASEVADRLRAMDDQLAVFEQHEAHWTTWTYKDVGVMGWVTLDPESDYMQLIKPILNSKRTLYTDFWMGWLPDTAATKNVEELARISEQTLAEQGLTEDVNRRFMQQAVLDNFLGGLLQGSFARLFKNMSEAELDRVLSSFSFRQCQPNEGLIELIKKHSLLIAQPAGFSQIRWSPD